MAIITFQPLNKIVEVPEGSTIYEAAVSAGVQIENTCGGGGTCGKCKVQIIPEEISDLNGIHREDSARKSGVWVLACKYKVFNNLTVRISEQKVILERKLKVHASRDIKINSSVLKYLIKVSEPNIGNQASDWERLLSALSNHNVRFNYKIAPYLPGTLRKANFQVTVALNDDTLIAVEAGDTRERCYGLAIDIGTTTVVIYLMNLITGQLMGTGVLTNPQQLVGADVVSRIAFASEGRENIDRLQSLLISGINEVISNLCNDSEISQHEIYQAVIVGNTTMSHLFLGIDPTYLASAPFIPAFRQSITVEAHDLKLDILDTSQVMVLPNIGGYVGSDTVGVMLATKVDKTPGICLVIDIGTNGEIVLSGRGRILTCSTAAGPAFEGAEIKCGMRAAEGAIEEVRIGDDVEFSTIGKKGAKGICGSGLIDAIAEMRRVGVIDASGRLVKKLDHLERLSPLLRKRLHRDEYTSEFILAWGNETSSGENIVLSQKDIRELQLAKAAIKAGVQILLKELGVSAEAIDKVFIAGAFGSYIKKENAVAIGLLPTLALDKVETVGNAAGDGAIMALISREEHSRAEQLATMAEHIELSTRRDFQEEFIKALTI